MTRNLAGVLFPLLSAWTLAGFALGLTVSLGVLSVVLGTMLPWAGTLTYALTCVGAAYAGAVFSRFAARAFPLRADGRRRGALVVAMFSGLAGAGALYTSKTLDLLEMRHEALTGRDTPQAMFNWSLANYALSAALPLFLLAVLPLLLVALRHLRASPEGGHPRVLFLRRFLSLSDRTLTAALASCLPPDLGLAYIASPGWGAASWDPMLVGFTGIRWLRPWSGIPLFLRTSDETWRENVARWVERTRAVVIDVSDVSPSVAVELELLRASAAGTRILFVHCRSPGGAPAKWPPGSETGHRLELIVSWRAALSRLLLGSVGALFTAALGAGLLVAYLFPRAGGWALPGLMAVLFALMTPLYLRPALDASSRRVLRDALLTLAPPSEPRVH
jgi:hypothetical protein